MAKKEAAPPSERIEKHFKTGNDHFDGHVFQLYKMALESELFENIEPVLVLFDDLCESGVENPKSDSSRNFSKNMDNQSVVGADFCPILNIKMFVEPIEKRFDWLADG